MENSILDERAKTLVKKYADAIMDTLPLQTYFRYPQVNEIIAAVPAPFKLRYNEEGGGEEVPDEEELGDDEDVEDAGEFDSDANN